MIHHAVAATAAGAAAVPSLSGAVKHALVRIAEDLLAFTGLGLGISVLGFRPFAARHGTRAAIRFSLRLIIALPLSWLPVDVVHALTGWPRGMGLGLLIWLLLVVALLALGSFLLPEPLRRFWNAPFAPADADSHGSAAFAGTRDARRGGHLRPAAADAFALGRLAGGRRRFYHD